MKTEYEFLDKINFPSDLKKISESKLQKVADELRKEMIENQTYESVIDQLRFNKALNYMVENAKLK